MNYKYIFFGFVFLMPVGIIAQTDDHLSITASRGAGRLNFEIVNKGKFVFFIGDVDKCGATLQVVSASINGGIPVSLKSPSPAWKHLVALTPKNDELSKMFWSYKFTITSDEIPKDKISKITLGIWIASESEFKKTTIESLQLKKFNVELVE